MSDPAVLAQSSRSGVADVGAATRWLCGPGTDIMMAFSWVPFAIMAFLLQSSPEVLLALMFAVFLFSFTHQPLTLVLVYGDMSRFSLRPRLFTWSPLFFGAAILLCMYISPLLLAVVAGLWNIEHTLMQRYGITRIYGRKVGQKDAGIELYLLFAWIILVLIYSAADPALLDKAKMIGFGGSYLSSLQLLVDLAPIARAFLPVLYTVVGVMTLVWLYQESRRPTNRAKQLYLFSTCILFVVMLIDPIAGFTGYVGAHAYEYFVIVNHNLALQYQKPGEGGGRVGTWARGNYGRLGFFAGYLALVVLFFVLRSFLPLSAIAFIAFMIGALHFFYDGFIWKLRNPAVAKGVGVS